ncbi:MAG: ImmA/IrrE family metallo-endopeptidase [Armatimonadota bacterium]|nr:ImmA/IrrE family metallo-endopeptidase [bacterium]
MNKYYTTEAERLADSAWRNLHLEPPIDLRRVCEHLKIELVRLPMYPDILGLYMRDEDGNAEIRVNSGMPIERQRFTLAHEIGHHIFSRTVYGRIVVEFRQAKHHLLERECDKFATCLFMPAGQVLDVAQQLGHPQRHDKTHNLAARFRVSAQAMRRRLRELGIDNRFR